MSLRKPPLIEVWISFGYEPMIGGGAWTEEKYKQFSKRIEETHPVTEQLVRSGFRKIPSTHRKRQLPEVQLMESVVAVRSFSEDGTRAILIHPNSMIVNYVRTEADEYPGFDKLLEEALAHNQAYLECYQSTGVAEAAVHYVDLIEVPIPDEGILRSEEYFTINLQLPSETFGSVAAFQLATVLNVSGSDDFVEVVFSTEPYAKEDRTRRFRLEWHKDIKSPGRMDEAQLRANLKLAHDRLYGCFRSVFTPKGWALFEPQTS